MITERGGSWASAFYVWENVSEMSTEIKRTLLESSPIAEMPGWETRLFLIEYPPGGDGSGHSHPVVGLGYVLEGSVLSAFDDDEVETFKAGQSFVDSASFHRVSRNGSETEPLRFLISYAVRIGEPNTVSPKQG
jgi:quercetin dioxygenase-like cupin family protein